MCVSAERVAARAEGQVLHLTLNRPEKRNAIDEAMVEALLEQAGCGGLITLEAVDVIRYFPRNG